MQFKYSWHDCNRTANQTVHTTARRLRRNCRLGLQLHILQWCPLHSNCTWTAICGWIAVEMQSVGLEPYLHDWAHYRQHSNYKFVMNTIGRRRSLITLRLVRCTIQSQKLSNFEVIGWVTKNLLTRASPCFGRHVKPLVLAAFVVVGSHQSVLGPRGGLWPVLLVCNP
jgi:hypothetical protein